MKEQWNRRLLGIALLAVALSLAACSGRAVGDAAESAAPQVEAGAAAVERPPAAVQAVGEPGDEAPADTSLPPAATAGAAALAEEAGERAASAELALAGADGAAAPAGAGAAPGAFPADTSAGRESAYVPPDQQFQPLRAGEIDDNEDFREYLDYRANFHQRFGYTVHDRDISERHIIRVTNDDGLPVLGAEVLVYDGQSLVTALRTTATGSVYFFPLAYPDHAQAQSYNVLVQKGRARTELTLSRGRADATWPVTLGAPAAQPPVKLDVLFLVDATGSMSDEIDELKNNILSMSAQIEALPSRPDVRFGLVHYRDRGDQYVTRVSDFTGDVRAFQRDLMNVSANGGGDAPESLNEALHRAVWDVNWRVEDTVSLIFLVADAPPHLDYSQDYDYAEEMQAAAELGIKVFPIGSRLDGPDPDQKVAEYVLRQIAQYTGGHFIFLTYKDTPQSSGEPGTEYDIDEGRYSVEDLDMLVVRLVQEELAALTGAQQ